ncbi:MAG: hypothetical protein H0W25_00080 [Acidimicrobiia bacterium]|nr:hypothetical protein [Acidimicrobiia bacterium]
MAFSEGLAIQASRRARPGQLDDDYFWYGHAGFEDWLSWCGERKDELVERFAAELDVVGSAETWFGSGLVDGKWRVGYFVADQLVAGMNRTLPELVAMDPAGGRAAIRAALGLG